MYVMSEPVSVKLTLAASAVSPAGHVPAPHTWSEAHPATGLQTNSETPEPKQQQTDAICVTGCQLTSEPPIKDIPKEDKPPNKGQTILYTKLLTQSGKV